MYNCFAHILHSWEIANDSYNASQQHYEKFWLKYGTGTNMTLSTKPLLQEVVFRIMTMESQLQTKLWDTESYFIVCSVNACQ